MKPKILLLCALLIVGTTLIANKVVQSRFWDPQRIEKSVQSKIPIGSTKTSVVNWLVENEIRYRQIHDINSSANRQQVIENTGVKSQNLQSSSGVIIGETREGLTPDDLYNIEIYFFFDKNDTLIITKFFKIWRGIYSGSEKHCPRTCHSEPERQRPAKFKPPVVRIWLVATPPVREETMLIGFAINR